MIEGLLGALIAAAIIVAAVWFGMEPLHRWAHGRDWFVPDCGCCPLPKQVALLEAQLDGAREATEKLARQKVAVADVAPVTDVDLARAYDTFLSERRPRYQYPLPDCRGGLASTTEPTGPQSYADLIASRPPREAPTPEQVREAAEQVRGKATMTITAGMVKEGERVATGLYCRRQDGKPAVTTPEIKARAQELVNAREPSPSDSGLSCPHCHDSGWVDGRFCDCPIGHTADEES